MRELQNCIERAAILTEGDTIHPRHLSLSFRAALADASTQDSDAWSRIDLSGSLADASRRTLIEVERRKIVQTLAEARGDVGRASEMLQIGYRPLLAKLKEYGLG